MKRHTPDEIERIKRYRDRVGCSLTQAARSVDAGDDLALESEAAPAVPKAERAKLYDADAWDQAMQAIETVRLQRDAAEASRDTARRERDDLLVRLAAYFTRFTQVVAERDAALARAEQAERDLAAHRANDEDETWRTPRKH